MFRLPDRFWRIDALVLLPGALLEPSEALLRCLDTSRRVIVLTYSVVGLDDQDLAGKPREIA